MEINENPFRKWTWTRREWNPVSTKILTRLNFTQKNFSEIQIIEPEIWYRKSRKKIQKSDIIQKIGTKIRRSRNHGTKNPNEKIWEIFDEKFLTKFWFDEIEIKSTANWKCFCQFLGVSKFFFEKIGKSKICLKIDFESKIVFEKFNKKILFFVFFGWNYGFDH